jgi:hypothetical protein
MLAAGERRVSPTKCIKRAIFVWRLKSPEPFRFVRFYGPEMFLGPDDALQGDPGRLPSLSERELEPLARIGRPDGPSISEAVRLLRAARRSLFELEAVDLVLAAPGPLPLLVRIEAAYLLAANGLASVALALLEDSAPQQARPQPASGDHFGLASHEVAKKVAREASVLAKYRALSDAPTAQPTRPRPPPLPRDLPSGEVAERDVECLKGFGVEDGPTTEKVIAILNATRRTTQGVTALRNLLGSRHDRPLPEPLRVLCAELLAEIGDHERAFALVNDVPLPEPPEPEPPGIDVDAPLVEGEAAARAAGAERVLANDTERLGVRERHTRFAAVARAARLTVDAFRALGGPSKRDALRDAARDLEHAGETRRAAEVYALGGHVEEADRVGLPSELARPENGDARAALTAVEALEKRGLRVAAVAAARAILAERPDPDIAAFARGVVASLVRAPIVTLAFDGREMKVAFGHAVTIGRSGATLVVASPLVSRTHVELRRDGGVAVVRDLGSHNGTWIAGARITAPLPVGAALDLALGNEIPCSLRAEPLGIVIDVAGERTLAPLGPLVVGGLRLAPADVELTPEDATIVITLDLEPEVRASLEDHSIETAIELARGDVVRVLGDVPHELRVLG